MMNRANRSFCQDAKVVLLLIFLFGLNLIFSLSSTLMASEKKSGLEEVKINLKLEDVPLNKVVLDIQKQTGYTVLLSESLVSLPASGVYSDVSVDKFFGRVLKGKNISIISDDKEKLIVVKAFGDKVIASYEKVSQERLNELVPGMSLTFEELRQQEEANKLELDEALNNPDTIDPISGLTLAEVRRQEELNKAALEEALNNPETIVPHSGDLTMEEVREVEKNNEAELTQRMNDPNTVDPVTGMKLGELRSIEEENKRVLDEALKNPDTIDPMTGLTLRELGAQENK